MIAGAPIPYFACKGKKKLGRPRSRVIRVSNRKCEGSDKSNVILLKIRIDHIKEVSPSGWLGTRVKLLLVFRPLYAKHRDLPRAG